MSFGDSVPLNPLTRTPAPPGSFQSDADDDNKTPAYIRRKSVAITGITTTSDFDPEVEFPDMEHQDKAGPSNPGGKKPQNEPPKTPEKKHDPQDQNLPITSENPGGDDPSDDDDDDGYVPRRDRDPAARSNNARQPEKGDKDRKALTIPKLDKLEGTNDFQSWIIP